jgi:hypothetical protein
MPAGSHPEAGSPTGAGTRLVRETVDDEQEGSDLGVVEALAPRRGELGEVPLDGRQDAPAVLGDLRATGPQVAPAGLPLEQPEVDQAGEEAAHPGLGEVEELGQMYAGRGLVADPSQDVKAVRGEARRSGGERSSKVPVYLSARLAQQGGQVEDVAGVGALPSPGKVGANAVTNREMFMQT